MNRHSLHSLTPAVAPLIVSLPVANVRLSSTWVIILGPDPSLPSSADWTILLLLLLTLTLLLRLLLRLLRLLRGHAVLRVDTEHLIRRPRRPSCRRRRRRRRRRNASEAPPPPTLSVEGARALSLPLSSLSQSVTPPHAVPLNALLCLSEDASTKLVLVQAHALRSN